MFSFDSKGNNMGRRLENPVRTRDGRTVDSTGAFLVGELERLDQTVNMPLVEYTWGRDIDLRTDVTIADEVASFTNNSVASAGGLGTGNGIGNGKSWMQKNTTQVTSQDVDISKTPQPMWLWGQEVKYTIIELEQAALLRRPIDQQRIEVLNMKHQMDIDEQVYIGDLSYRIPGLFNATNTITPVALPAGVSTSSSWLQKSPDEILADFNTMLTTVWRNSAYAVRPDTIRIPPVRYGYISTAKVATASGLVSIKRYIEENNLLTVDSGRKLNIESVKWCAGLGVGGTIGDETTVNRAVCYTKDRKYVQFPMVPLLRTPIQYDGIYQKFTYYGRLGQVEFRYPETVGYFDGL